MRAYYLTGSQFALSNLALRRIKISRFGDLNDPFELLAVDLADKAHRRAFRATKEQLAESKGLICLSRSWANPLLWGHYAERHTGMALGFEVAEETGLDATKLSGNSISRRALAPVRISSNRTLARSG